MVASGFYIPINWPLHASVSQQIITATIKCKHLARKHVLKKETIQYQAKKLTRYAILYLQDIAIGDFVISSHIQTDEDRATVLATKSCQGLD